MKFLVLGAGGIGGYFGGRLAEAGADVSFLVRPARRDQLERDGLLVESPYGHIRRPVRTVLQSDLQDRHDVVLLACKAYDLHTAMDAVAPGLADTGVIVPLLNGLSHLDTLSARFGRERVLGGTAKIAATLTPNGVVRHLSEWNAITLGEQGRSVSERVRSILASFPSGSVTARASPDIMQEMWEKAVHLVTAASATCLMRASIGEIVRTPGGRSFLQTTFDTVTAIAAANGHPPSAEFLVTYRALFSDAASKYTTSMLRDIEAGNRIEVDHIVGFMLERARVAGIESPTLETAYTQLKAYEVRCETRV